MDAVACLYRVGEVEAFTSWCGGLPEPTASGNPLGYKFSWSPRGVLLAGLNGAVFTRDGQRVEIQPGTLLRESKPIDILPGFAFEGYPNRDSTLYAGRLPTHSKYANQSHIHPRHLGRHHFTVWHPSICLTPGYCRPTHLVTQCAPQEFMTSLTQRPYCAAHCVTR